jgi:hypothetical protein
MRGGLQRRAVMRKLHGIMSFRNMSISIGWPLEFSRKRRTFRGHPRSHGDRLRMNAQHFNFCCFANDRRMFAESLFIYGPQTSVGRNYKQMETKIDGVKF